MPILDDAKGAPLDVLISFDTTGSMYACISEVRKNTKELVTRLFRELPDLRIALIVHGDYSDAATSYVLKKLDFTNNAQALVSFIDSTTNTDGHDYPECYELVLHEAQSLAWRPGALHAMVVIGDAFPHEPEHNPMHLDWRQETRQLRDMNVAIYSVQALYTGRNSSSYVFYKQMADVTGGYHLMLDQFSYVRDILLAICFRQAGTDELRRYEQELVSRSAGLTVSMRNIFDKMLGRASTLATTTESTGHASSSSVPASSATAARVAHGSALRPCPPAKYQIMDVDRDCSIKDFVTRQHLVFKAGKGFYQFKKAEEISPTKLVVLRKQDTGELFEGDAARTIAGIPSDAGKKKIKPGDVPGYDVFVQSTSYNRKLQGGTMFLYEAEDYDRE
jgi:hypothetical protein